MSLSLYIHTHTHTHICKGTWRLPAVREAIYIYIYIYMCIYMYIYTYICMDTCYFHYHLYTGSYLNAISLGSVLWGLEIPCPHRCRGALHVVSFARDSFQYRVHVNATMCTLRQGWNKVGHIKGRSHKEHATATKISLDLWLIELEFWMDWDGHAGWLKESASVKLRHIQGLRHHCRKFVHNLLLSFLKMCTG